MFSVDKVTLSEPGEVQEAEVIQRLGKIPGFITVLLVVVGLFDWV